MGRGGKEMATRPTSCCGLKVDLGIVGSQISVRNHVRFGYTMNYL